MIHIILGTKAQLIKMAPVMRALRERRLKYRYISTGQHRETITDVLQNFGLARPDYVLYNGPDVASIPRMAIWLIRILWKTVRKRGEIFSHDRKGIVLVHGDTFSTLLGALMGRVAGLEVGHVESGLRSFNWLHPFPEEITRLLAFRLSQILFCPGPWAIANVSTIRAERFDTEYNTLADSLRFALSNTTLEAPNLPPIPFAIVTLHRFENIYRRVALEQVIAIIERIALSTHLLFILHPPTEKRLRDLRLYERLLRTPNLEVRKRYDYFRFIKLLSKAEFVISDGGSNQEECFYLGQPILLLRKATERQEGLGENCVLSKYDPVIIDRFVDEYKSYRRTPRVPIRSASEIIAEACLPFSN